MNISILRYKYKTKLILCLLKLKLKISTYYLISRITALYLYMFILNITWSNRMRLITKIYIFSFTTNPTKDDYFMTIYIKSHTRAGPYIVGAIFGYLLYRRKNSTTKLNLVRYIIKRYIIIQIQFIINYNLAIFLDMSLLYNQISRD